MGRVIEYMKLSRFHSTPLEAVIGFSAALLASGSLGPALWGAVYGALYHIWGYSENSVVDYVKGYDKNDPNKKEHPLRKGTIYPSAGKKFYVTAAAILFLLVFSKAAQMGLKTEEGAVILSLFAIQFLTATVYNSHSKKIENSWLPISIAHSLVFTIPFIAFGGSGVLLYAGSAYVFFWTFFQIAVSGEFKDINNVEEANFLRETDVHWWSGETAEVSDQAMWFSLLVIFPGVAISSTWFFFQANATDGLAFTLFLLINFTTLSVLYAIIDGEPREKVMKFTVLREASCAYGIYVVSLSVLSNWIVVPLLIAPLFWVLLSNKVMWGDYIVPDV